MPGYPIEAISATTVTSFTDGGATPTVVLSSVAVSTAGRGGQVNLTGTVNITPGTSAVAVVLSIVRGITAGSPVVGVAQTITVVAGNKYSIPFDVVDTPEDESGQQYSIVITETSAAANGTVNFAMISGQTN